MFRRRFVTMLLAVLALPAAVADSLTVAVASNFIRPANELVARFEARTGAELRLVSGSTGKLYAQIANGAPFDVFLAADAERPRRLTEEGLGIEGSRFTFATGALVLWSRDPELAGADCRQVLDELGDRNLAIANPETAPYGQAARAFLEAARLWDRVRQQLVFGESIAQTLHFVASGNASLGLIAASQAADERLPAASCQWPVPQAMYAPLKQQVVLLSRAANNPAARGFIDFLRGAEAGDIIREYGYTVAQ